MKNKLCPLLAGVALASLVGNAYLAKGLAASRAETARQRDEIAKLQAETARLDGELWKLPRGLDFNKPFGVEPGALIDDASLAAKFMDTEGAYVGFKPGELVGEKDSRRIAEVSGYMDRQWPAKPEAEKAAAALRAWMACWMADSKFGWTVETAAPEQDWTWRVRFRVIEKDLAAKIKARETAK